MSSHPNHRREHGRVRDQCGQPRCRCCHPEKVRGIPPKAERKAALSEREQLAALQGGEH